MLITLINLIKNHINYDLCAVAVYWLDAIADVVAISRWKCIMLRVDMFMFMMWTSLADKR